MTIAPDASTLRSECAAQIAKDYGYFTGHEWLLRAFHDVPRHHYVPRQVWWPKRGDDGLFPMLDADHEPGRWLKAVYRPRAPLITQIRDGAVRPEDGPTDSNEFTSSISCPAVVVQMLHHLDPRPGQRVLEIGTGTGYNAALLAERTASVVTVEIAPDLADRARARLEGTGVRVVCADGEDGCEGEGPYDRIISTACVTQIPAAWVRQLSPGGVLLTPLATPLGMDGLARLEADGQGGARGHLVAGVNFMLLRSHRTRRSWKELGWRWPNFHLTATAESEQQISADIHTPVRDT
ncbi:methyltransferase domain-containing protein [Streptomyces sp. NPDC054796]